MDKRNYNTMTLQQNERLALYIFIIAAISAVATYAWRTFNSPVHVPFSSQPAIVVPFTSPVITPTPVPDKPVVTEFPASDGKKNLTMKKIQHTSSTAYSFWVSTIKEPEPFSLFSKDVSTNITLSVPFNAWSPDDGYVFLKEEGSGPTNYYVFPSNGKGFSEDKPFVNVTEYFQQKFPDLLIEDVTGWADNTLLIVNTKTKDGVQGYSYWFVVTNQTFIRLSTHFY